VADIPWQLCQQSRDSLDIPQPDLANLIDDLAKLIHKASMIVRLDPLQGRHKKRIAGL
jgi:hypothetical protein